MKLTFLGTGTSQGVPVIACNCIVCKSENPQDKRLRSSVLIESDTTSVVIDTGPDFRQQMLSNAVQRLNAIVYTHEHKDHVAGMDDVRAFNFKFKTDMPIYASEAVQKALRNEFHYVFSSFKYPGVPKVNFHTIDADSIFQVGDITFQSIELLHHKLQVFGYRINDLVYITDANYIDAKQIEKIKDCKVLILNALRKEKHLSHFTLDEAVALAKSTQAERVYFTHISHLMGTHNDTNKLLEDSFQLAYDGLSIEF
ncbi:MAG: MBL fold metallo-hydrolase [Flavobacteriales bacterium]